MQFSVTFKPKHITKKLLAILPSRERDVLTGRYGLGNTVKRDTLETIGSRYTITRERVRQIENRAISAIRTSPIYKEVTAIFTELSGIIVDMGGIVPEQELLDAISKNEGLQNHIHFLLIVGNDFERLKEDPEFIHRWHADQTIADSVHTALRNLYRGLTSEDLVPEAELISKFLKDLTHLDKKHHTNETAKRWLSLSKKISRNQLGEWGRVDAPGVRVKNMRDMAYLALKRHGSPMHFGEVARSISELFGRKAHEATCHNELIKDERFVLVGRGLYALSEWGYSRGVVKEVIKDILRKEGPMTKKEIIDRVKRERYVKDGTILVNLQDGETFLRAHDGKFTVSK
jgi:hypothetical protein